MTDPKNPGQFGERPDTEQQAHRGGESSPTKFSRGADPSKAGRKGAQNQPTEAKRRGGQNSRRG